MRAVTMTECFLRAIAVVTSLVWLAGTEPTAAMEAEPSIAATVIQASAATLAIEPPSVTPGESDTAVDADSLAQKIARLREVADYAQAGEHARALLTFLQHDPASPPWAVADAERLLATLMHATTLPPAAQQELAEADRLTIDIEALAARGAYAEAADLTRRQLAVRQRHLGAEHPEVAESMSDLGVFLKKLGEFAAAEEQCRGALALRETLLGPRHPKIAGSLSNLGQLHCEQGRYDQAAAVHVEALHLRETLLGPEDPAVAASLLNLSVVRYYQGRYAAEESLLTRALAIYTRVYGPDHPKVAVCLSNIGTNCTQQGRYVEAERHLKRALAIREQALGPAHPDLALDLDGLGMVYRQLGRYRDAERLLARSLAIQEQSLGPEHPKVAESLNRLGVLYMMQGRYAAAERAHRRALAIGEETWGAEHDKQASIFNNLALTLWRQGRLSEVELLLRRTLAIRVKTLKPDHPGVATCLSNLGTVLDEQGQYAEAEELLREALAIRERALGPDHTLVASTLNNLAVLYQGQRRFADAEPLLLRALDIQQRALGPDNPGVAEMLCNLAVVRSESGDVDAETQALLERALVIRERTLGPDHADVARSLAHLADLHLRRGEYAEAAADYERALPIAERALGDQHALACEILTGQARCCLAREHPADAAMLLSEAAAKFESARLRVRAGTPRAAFTASPYALLAVAELRAGRVQEAWPAAERALGRVLADLLLVSGRRSLNAAEAATEDSLQMALGELESQLEALNAAVATAQTPTGPDAAVVGLLHETRDRLLAAEAAWSSFQHDLAARYPVAAGQPFALASVQSALRPNTALMGWLSTPVVGEDQATWGYVIRDTGPVHWRRLDPAMKDAGSPNLTGDVEAMRAALHFAAAWQARTLVTDEIDALAAKVWAAWGAPLAEHMAGIEELVIIPSGPMLGVPVEALVDASGAHIGDRYAISYAPSATVLAWLHEESTARVAAIPAGDANGAASAARAHVSQRMTLRSLLLGDPPFAPEHMMAMRQGSITDAPDALLLAGVEPLPEAATLRGALAGDAEALASLPRLPWTRREVQSIAAVLSGAVTLVGPQASEQEMARLNAAGDLKQYDIIHLATHALVDDARPERSALVLARADLPDPLDAVLSGGRVVDGLLTAKEVVREWNVTADLVTLSGCQTGLGHEVAGEGYIGLAHAFLQAGARSMLVSLWRVEDEATCLLMTRFYENLAGSYRGPRLGAIAEPMSKTQALREAKQWLRTHTDGEGRLIYRHPVYWSGFVLIGEAH